MLDKKIIKRKNIEKKKNNIRRFLNVYSLCKIIFGTSLCYNRKKKKWIMQEERDKEIMGDRNGPT